MILSCNLNLLSQVECDIQTKFIRKAPIDPWGAEETPLPSKLLLKEESGVAGSNLGAKLKVLGLRNSRAVIEPLYNFVPQD